MLKLNNHLFIRENYKIFFNFQAVLCKDFINNRIVTFIVNIFASLRSKLVEPKKEILSKTIELSEEKLKAWQERKENIVNFTSTFSPLLKLPREIQHQIFEYIPDTAKVCINLFSHLLILEQEKQFYNLMKTKLSTDTYLINFFEKAELKFPDTTMTCYFQRRRWISNQLIKIAQEFNKETPGGFVEAQHLSHPLSLATLKQLANLALEREKKLLAEHESSMENQRCQ